MSSPFIDNDGNRDWKTIWYHARSGFVVLLSLAVLIGGAWFVYDKANKAYVSYKTTTDYMGEGVKDLNVTIPPGFSGGQIGDLLVEQGVVKSRKGFLKAYNNNDKANTIQAGTYKLRTEIPAETAITMLLDPKNVVRNQVTIPEGLWMSDQFALLSKKTGIPVAQFTAACANPQSLGFPAYVKSCEGFLFPQTYEMGQKPTAVSILKLMAAQYNAVAKKYDIVGAAKEQDRTPLEIMTIASILQAEAKVKDMPMVAGIIANRLERGEPLGLDSTAHFQLKIPMNKLLPAGFKEIGKDSSYNTFANQGLPEGPIDAPGEPAIKAATKPTKNDYMYWLTVNFETGETKYAKTQDEQNQHENEWKAWCKTAKNKSGCPA